VSRTWKARIVTVLSALFFLAALPAAAGAHDVVVGVNAANLTLASVAQQDAMLAQLKAAGVTVLRCNIADNMDVLSLAKRAKLSGIRLLLVLPMRYRPGASKRAYQLDASMPIIGGYPLSSADPAQSRAFFQELLDGLDKAGVALAGLELGNEINFSVFNPDFAVPGQGRVFNSADLVSNPGARRVAAGLELYIKVLAALKGVRDNSRLNRNTPIILAGLVDFADGDTAFNAQKIDKVSLSATIGFLRAHGLDSFVDVYGIHTYPNNGVKENVEATKRRRKRFWDVTLANCQAANSTKGKPCWITEWGFANPVSSCPLNDTDRVWRVSELRQMFAQAATEGKLTGMMYFQWNSDPGAKKPDPKGIYRCGSLTQSGRIAIAPLD
jgi:hypothetical protein